jgi:hypothetical protein
MKRVKLNKKRTFILIIVLLLIGVALYFGINYYLKIVNGEEKYLIIKLNGESEVTIRYGEEYNDSGEVA